MIRRLLLVMVLVGLGAQGARGAVVEADLEPAGKLWVGQRARLRITVLVPRWFARAPRFRLPEVPGLLILDTGDRPVNTSRTVDGEALSGTITEFAVIARRGGTYTIPGIEFRYSVAGPPGSKSEELLAEAPSVSFNATLPPGADGLATLISAPEVTVTQTYDPDSSSGQAGDAISRRVVFEADEVPGMAFPPIDFGRMEGVSIYADTPEIVDERERGAFRGRRTDRSTFVWQREGVFRLPTLVFIWWNTKKEKLERIELPGREVKVGPGAYGESGGGSGRNVHEGIRGPWWFLIISVFVVLAATAFLAVRASRRRQAAPAAVRYRELVLACRSNDRHATDQALLRWVQTISAGDESPTVADLARSARIPALLDEFTALQNALIRPKIGWAGDGLLSILPQIRKSLMGRQAGGGGGVLPPLNPCG